MPPKARPKKSRSGIKRAKQSVDLNLKNRAERTKLRTFKKKLLAAVEAKDKGAVSSALKDMVKALSSASSKGIIHKNTASRNVSRLSKLANSVLKPEAA